MARLKRVLFALLILFGLLAVAAALLVKFYVTPARVQSLVQQGLEQTLQRPVTLGTFQVGLFSGIKLDNLSIQDKNSSEDLLSAQNIELAYDFKALLRGELQFGQIKIKAPLLRLVREADGRLNIDDLLGGQGPQVPASADPQNASPAAAPVSFSLVVRSFSLQGGTLIFLDRKTNPASPYRYRLEALDIEVDNFALNEVFPVRLKAVLNGAAVAINLNLGLKSGLQRLELNVQPLDLVPFLPYLQAVLPGSLGRGVFSAKLSLLKQQADFVARGQLTLDQLDIRLDLETPLHWDRVRIAVDQDLIYRPRDRVVEVKKMKVDIDGLAADYQGKVLLDQVPKIAGEVNLQIQDLRKIAALLPLELRQPVAAYAMAGAVDMHLLLEGELKDARVVREATVKLTALQASFGSLRPALSGTLNYAAGQIKAPELKIDLKDQQLQLALEVGKVLSALPHLELLVRAERLDFDPFISPQTSTGPNSTIISPSSPAGAPRNPASPPPVLPLTARVRLQVQQLGVQGAMFENVQGQFLIGEGLLRVESLTAELAGGNAKIAAVVALEQADLPVSGDLSLTGIDLATLVDGLWPDTRGRISGRLMAASHFNVSAGASDPLAGLRAAGRFDLQDGEINGGPLLAELSRFLVDPELEILGFKRFSGTYSFLHRQGAIDAQLESRRLTLAPLGTFTSSGDLDLGLETRIAPGVMAKTGFGGRGMDLIKDEKGWTLLPLKVSGTYEKPHFSLDATGVKRQFRKKLEGELEKALQQKTGDKPEDSQKQQIQKLLDGTLKKLFGN
jgi:AsmA protein